MFPVYFENPAYLLNLLLGQRLYVLDLLVALKDYETLNVRGLMTLAIFTDEKEPVRKCFQLLRRIRDEVRDKDPDLIGPGELSMGMSGDFELAIEESSNVVRVGQSIFGKRATKDSDYWPTAL